MRGHPRIQNPRLDPALLPFRLRLRAPSDAAAHAVFSLADLAIPQQGANGHVELSPPPRRDEPDCPRINAPRGRFDMGDDLHRPDLWRACDRGWREERPENIAESRGGPGPDSGGHLPEGRGLLYRSE